MMTIYGSSQSTAEESEGHRKEKWPPSWKTPPNFKLFRLRRSSAKKGPISAEILISKRVEKSEAAAVSPRYISNVDISLLVESGHPFPGLQQANKRAIRLRKNLRVGRYKRWFS